MAEAYAYRAFVSYSHRDHRFARKLHRRLEFYRLPKAIDGGGGRLGRIYLDKEELGAVTSLPAEMEQARAVSETLVVIASRNSLQSKWVRQEIATFGQVRPNGLSRHPCTRRDNPQAARKASSAEMRNWRGSPAATVS